MSLLDRIPLQTLIVAAIFLGGAPFMPEPHIWQKLKMLASGQLTQMLDIVDLLFHITPSILLIAKLTRAKPPESDQD